MAQDIQTPPADAAKENKTKRKVTYTPVRTVSGSELREMAGDGSGVLENEWNDPSVRTFTEDGFKGVYPLQPPERYHTDEELEEAMPTGNAAGIGAGMVFSGGAIPPSVAKELYKNETSRAGNTSERYARMKEERAWRDNEAKYAVESAIADGFKPDGTSMRNIQEKYVVSYYYTAKGRDRYNKIKEETNRLKEYLTPYIEQETAGNPLYQKAVADYRAGKISMEQLAETQEMLRRESPSYKKAAEWSMEQNRQYAREASDYFSPYIEKEMVPFMEQGLDKSISDFRSLQGERPDEFTGVADNLLNKAEKLRDAARNGGFLTGMGDTASDWNFWSLGIADLYRAKNIREIADKADKALREGADVEFTPEELNTLQAYAIYQQALNLYSEKVPLSYTMGQVTAEMIPFAASIALGQGLARLTTKGISAVAKKAATQEVAQAVSQALGKSKLLNSRFAQGFRQGAGFGGETTGAAGVAGNMLGGMTRGTGEALTVGAPRTWAEKNERMTGQADIDVTDSGQPLITGFSGRESGGEAFAHALAGNAIEYQSERAGQLMDRLGGALKARLPKDLQLSMGSLGDYIKSITPKSLKRFYKSPYYKAFRDNIQLQGVWAEYGEEELANWERVLLGLDEPDVLLDNEQRVETFLSLLPAQLMMGAGAGVYSAGRYRQASARLDKLMKEMKASDPELYEKYGKVRGKMDGFDVKAVTGLLSSIDRDGKLNADQKTEVKRAALAEYYTKMLKSAQEAEIFGRADEEMKQAYEQAEALKERGSGNIVTADYEGRKVNITDDTGSDTVVIEYVEEDGKRVKRQVPRSAVGNAATMPVADVVNSKADEITARVKAEMQDLEHPGLPAPEPGTRLVHNGENYAVTSISPDGVVIMREDEEGNYSLPEVISTDTYYAEKQAEIDAQEQEQQPQSGERGEAAQEIASPAEEEPAPVTGGGAVQEETAPGRMPKDEQGQPIYEQADPDTAWDALLEQAGGDEAMAQEVANDIVSEQEKALKAAERELKKVQDGKPQQRKGDAPLTVEARIAAKQAVREQTSRAQAGVDEARKRLEAWRKIAETPQRRRRAIEAERRQEEEEAARLRGIQEEQERAEREEAERIRREALNGVPDFIEDRPQDARARGYRRVNGNRVDRQQPIQARRGGEVQVKFDDNNIPTGHAALIEASQLQPSHTDGRRNPQHFIDEAQPKERNDEASVMSARKIAANIRPEEITSSVTAYTGAPTVNSRGEVIQGNNRSAALREMWAEHPEQAAKYRQYLADHAADFDLTPEDVEAMQQPVLVNMLDVTDDEAITLGQFVAQDTESGGTERIKPKNMVRKMGDDMRGFANRLLASADEEMSFAELVDRNGVDVLKWMQQKGYITPTQYKSAFDSKGNLTAEAKNDLKGVMYQSIFQNGSSHLEEMFNALPAKAQKAILATAYRDYDSPNTERMIEEIQNSISAYHALSQDPAFAGAGNYKEARIAAEAWKRQYAFDDATGESYLPSERYSNFALLLATMYKGQTQKFIQNTLGHIYDLVQGTQEADLFNQPDNTPRTLVQAINETLGNLREELLLNENFTYNGQRRSNVLAGGSASGQRGRQGSDGNAPSGGRAEDGTRTDDGSGRTGISDNERGRQGNFTDIAGRQQDSLEASEGEVRLSDEIDENGRQFVLTSNGQLSFGEITEESGLTPAPILLSEGIITNPATNDGYGLVHIEARHGDQIRKAGYKSVIEFIEDVAQNYERVKEGNIRNGNPTYLIQLKDKHNNTLIVELSSDGNYWNINTAGIFKESYGKNRREIYNRHTTVQQSAETVGASQEAEQSGTTTSSSMNAPTSNIVSETPVKTEPQQPNNAVSTGSSLSENEEGGITSSEPNGKPTVSGSKDKKTSAETSQERQKTDSNLSEAFKQQMNIRIGQLSKFIKTKDGKLKKKYESLRKTPFFAIFDSGNIYEGPVAIAKTPREALNVAFNYDIGDFEVLYVDFRTKSLDMDLLSIYDVSGFRGDVYDENGAYKDEAKNLLVERISRLGKGNSTDVQGVEDFQQRESGADALLGNADENIRRAESEVERNPTEAQKEAGNYRKGHVRVDGLDVTIENPKGSVRSGTDADGKRWENVMNNTYGYMRGTEGVDGDHIDVFLSDNPESGNVYVVDQRDPKTGEFDEHKVMYGFGSMEEARDAYLKNYTPGWQGLGTITEVSKDEFRKWIGSSKRKTKPFAEYKSVKKEAGQNEDVRQSRDVSSPLSAEEAAIRDAIVERLRESGIEVIEDTEAGQKVLDVANGRGEPVRTQAMLDGLAKAASTIRGWIKGNRRGRVFTIDLPESTQRKIKEAMGRDFDSHNITANGIAHALKNHGVGGYKLNERSIPLREEDMELIPYIMTAPDDVKKASTDVSGRESVRFYKNLSNGYVVVVEKEYKNSPDDMETITMWAELSSGATNARQNAVPDTHVLNAIPSTDSAKIRKDAEDAIRGDEKVREHRVYHGSGADFEAFDHSHMGEGEGAQAYGWGSYVTEVEGIGRMYAESARKKPTYLYGGKEMPSDEFYDYVLGEIGDRNENMLNDFMYNLERHGVTRAKDILKKGDLAQYKNLFYQSIGDTRNYAEGKIKAARTLLSLKGIRIRKPKSHLYTIEIPDDNGKNYLDWDSKTGKDLVSRLVSTLRADKELKEAYEGRLSELNKELGKFAPRTLFSDTYVQLAELLGSDKKASQLLSSLGYAGIKYPADYRNGGREDGAKNYVIFNEKDAKITDHVRFFRTPGGEAYGFTVGGKIYIDPRMATADTPIHEYAHLWAGALRQANPKEWNNIVELMRGTPAWDEVKRLYPELESDEEIADEALAMYSGRRGAERLREAARRAWDGSADLGAKAAAARAMGRVRDALKRFWKGVADFLHIHYTSAEEVADKVMSDLLEGVNPNSRAELSAEERAIEEQAKKDGTWMKAPNGKPTNLTEKQWVQVRTRAFKDWFGDWEKAAKLRMIDGIKPTVVSEPVTDKVQSKKEYANIGEATNRADGRTVQFFNSAFDKIYRNGGLFAKAVKGLKDCFENSILAYSEKDNKGGTPRADGSMHKSHPNVDMFHNYVGKVSIDGKEYFVRFTVQEEKSGTNGTHSFFVSEVDVYEKEMQDTQTGLPLTRQRNENPASVVDAKLRQFLEEAKDAADNSSKVVDENGEPLVVYHGSDYRPLNGNGILIPNNGAMGKAVYFSSAFPEAADYAREKLGDMSLSEDEVYDNGYITEVFVNVRDEEDIAPSSYGNGEIIVAVRESNQIKSATDNTGAFSAGNDDIRYRMAEEDKSLVAVHNTSEENLKKALELGGFPMPSIAITKADVGHTAFGEISLVFGKDSINPTDRRNKVYGEDAWTPTFPTVGYKLNEKKTSEIYGRANRAGSLPLLNPVHFHPDNYESSIGWGNLIDRFRDDYGAKQLFLFENGKPVEKFERHEVEKYLPDKTALYEKMLDRIGLERLKGERNEALEDEVKRLIGEHYNVVFFAMSPIRVKARISSAIRNAVDYAENGNKKTENDIEATKKKIDRRVDKKKFEEWLHSMFDGIVEKRGIRNDKDPFTASGNRRRWEQLYDEITLDNVVEAMRRQAARGGQGLFGGSIFGAAQEEYKDIDSVRKAAKRRIRMMSHEEAEAGRKAITDRLSAIEIPGVGERLSDVMDMVQNIQDAVARSHTAKGIYKYLKAFYPKVTMETANEIADIVKDIQAMSARYFEAKPYRAVGFDEVRLAVVPSDTDAGLVEQLKRKGIPVREYERGNEAERRAIVDEATDEMELRFRETEEDDANRRFNEELSGLTEENADKVVLSLGRPSAILRAAGVEDKPMKLYGNKVIKKMKKHGFRLDELQNLPEAVAEPIAVFNNYQKDSNRSILTELRTSNGNFLVTVDLGKDADVDFNIVTSVFGKGDNNIIGWINKGYATYIDKEKAQEFLSHQSAPIAATAANSELDTATNIVKDFENPSLEDENLFRIGETKRIGRQGKKITFTRANPTVTLNALKKRLENEGVEYKVHKARTGSGYISFEREGIYYDLRSANHTRAYTSYNASDDTGGVELSFTREDGRIDGIDIDLSENEMGVNEIYSLMDEAARFNANDTGMFAVTERLVYPEEINGYEHIAAALGKKADDLIREREMALRAEYARYKDTALQGYERPNLLPFKAGNGAVVEDESVRKVYFNGKPAFKRYANEALSEYFRERNKAMHDFEAAHAMSYDEWLASAHPEIRQEEDNMRDGTGAVTDDEVSMENDPMSKLAGKSIRTRKQRQAFAERERRRMAGAVREMAERLHLDNVEVVTDASTLTGRRARAKGFYSPRTGKIVIVIPNHASEADAMQTLLHEAVAHKGLRQLFGEHFDTFLWNVYRNADRAVRERINALASEKGWDFPTATEEYLASLAENTDFENAQRSGWWEKIKRLFIDMLHKIGLDGFGGVTLSDNELRYILWRSYENLREPGAERSITGVAADVVKQAELKVGNYAEDATGGDMAAERKSAMTEKQRRIEKLRRSEPVVATGEEYKGKYELNNKSAADYIIKSLKGEYVNKDTGVPIKITRKGAFKITRHDAENEAHLKSIALIPRLIENAVFVEEEPNSKANNGFDSYRYYVAGLNMAGADYTVKMAVGVKNGETYYDHSLTEIEKSNLINRIDEISSSFTDNKIAISDLKDKRLVSILQTDEEENEDELMYRDGSAEEDGTRDTPLSSPTVHAWDRLAQSLKFQLRETTVDYLTAIDKFQDLIAKHSGRKIESFENAYDWMTFLTSRNRVEMDMFDSSVVRPLNNAILKLTGKKRRRGKWKWDEGALRELVMYVEAKHGTDRNRQMSVERYVEGLPEQKREGTMAAWTAEKKRINSQNISWIEKQRQLDAAAARIGADIEQDYSGLSSMFGDTDQYPGGWREASLLYAADYEAVHESADIASLWNAIDAATSFALRKQYETGLVSREYVDRQRERFEHYIPLRGFSDETAGDVYSYIGHDFYPGGNPVKAAHGRMSEAGNPFGSMLNIAYSSISAGNKNMAKTALYALVRNHDTDGLAMVNRAWMVRYDKLKEMPELSDVATMPTFEAGEETPEWVEAVPRIAEAATSDDITRIMSKFEDVMTEYRKKDFTKPIRKNNTTAYRTLNKERSEHDIPLFIAGEKYVITVTGNPRPAQAMNGLLNPDVNEDALSELGKRVQRFMAGAFTGKNAAFSIANLFRDTIYANNQMFIRENPAYWLKFTRNQRLGFGDFIPMMRRLKKFREGTLGNSKDDRLFEEFMQNGGATGYTFVNTQEEYARELAGKLDELSRKTPEWFSPKGLVKLFFDAVQFAGESAELVNRFAAYKTSREMGRTMGRSIRDAKEITVNFNRKGAGRKSADKNKSWYSPVNMASAVSQYGRCSILFWNANMQGKYRFYKNMTEHPVKTSVTLIANNMALAAVVLPLLNNVALPMLYELTGLGDDGDDENYFNVLTDWERTHNICIRLPKSNWLKIPVSPDFVSWFSMGDAIGGQVSGEREMSAKDFITAVIDAVSPLSMNWSYEGSQMLLNFAPTVTQPLLQNAMNVNFMGNPLKKTPYNSKQGFKPEYQMVYSSASPTLVELSRLSNRIMGGTDLKTSGWADWNPAELQNLISGYTGGYGTTFLSAADWIVGTAKGEKQAVTFSRMPLVSRFAISGNKDVQQSRVNSRFYDVKNFVDEFEYDLKSYEDAIELAQKEKDAFKTAEYVSKREELVKSERAGRYQLLKGYVKAAKDCEDYLEELPEDEVTRNFLYNLKQEAINLLHGEYKTEE